MPPSRQPYPAEGRCRPSSIRAGGQVGGATAVRRRVLSCAAIAAFLVCAGRTTPVDANPPYPAGPISLIVPFVAGGPTDIVARLIGESMSVTLGQQIVIENVTGAGGTTAGTRTMRSAPDGYTVMMGHMGTHAAAVGLYPNLAYNPSTDFAPIGMVAGMPIAIVARNGLPAGDLREFVAYAKQHATELTMAHAGSGSVSQVTCRLFNTIAGLNPRMSAFQGSGPAMNALVAGKVDYMCDQMVAVVPKARANLVHVLAVGTPTRNPALPGTPTAAEAGMPQFEVSAWNALFAPRATPKPIVAKLNAALTAALDNEKVRERLTELGGDIPNKADRSPDALAALVKSEIARWTPLLQTAEKPN